MTATPGYEELAEAITALLETQPSLPVSDDDIADACAQAESAMGEVIKPAPDRTLIKRPSSGSGA